MGGCRYHCAGEAPKPHGMPKCRNCERIARKKRVEFARHRTKDIVPWRPEPEPMAYNHEAGIRGK